ncbi:MAG: exodeoxyribonuclease VII small subunit [Sphingomonadales bacterium]
MAEDLSTLSFEDALKRLENIVHRLESGEASLEDSIALYTEGSQLRGQCEERLKSAQEKIDKIVLGADGTPTGVRPFDGS